ncbi:MAG TPA: diaminopimelate epimerase [Rubricoccaceae bacterium]|jgi:diaminopimelate epimerase
MPPALVVPFTKMSGAGNDFVVLDNRFLRFSDAELAALAARVCPRRVGVGADGLLALDDPEGGSGADFRMRYRNADGSLATMCGNGARCLARFAARAGLGREVDGGVALVFDTDGGRYTAVAAGGRAASGPVCLDVPAPRAFAPVVDIPGVLPADAHADPLVRIWTGTEHVVAFVSSAAAVDLAEAGPRIRHDAAFAPAGTNVNVAEVTARGEGEGDARMVVRTFEKGVEGETLACGTGALAAALAAYRTGRVAVPRVRVAMPGGVLRVTFAADGASGLTLDGPAETVYEGTLEA